MKDDPCPHDCEFDCAGDCYPIEWEPGIDARGTGYEFQMISTYSVRFVGEGIPPLPPPFGPEKPCDSQ